MTKENCIRLLKHYRELMQNPTGVDSVERNMVKEQSTKAYADMKQHMLTSRKFKGDPVLEELGLVEKKEDGKKPKR